ncbi:DUF11 domain-containing protein [Clostridium weizhouense]|uniref:DUF11 domain-containing protein n=1 Tax=Clostridium weizhouense TaxID=2859781 RepID=A0ABS7AKS0_9CLOT|nr:DUF11 domain-containing protein [Clostridium weizhouense]MBW6409251.1 DUF11 domain-containing protein [Clostridium weizhouense]
MGILSVSKIADRSYMFIGISNKIRYSIVITNTGNERVNSIKVNDILSKGACFIPGTLTLNGCRKEELKNQIINIGYMDPEESIIISFDAKVNPNCPPDYVSNKAVVTYMDNYNNSMKVESNEVVTPVINIDVCLKKSVDKKVATVGEIISYFILIRNNSNVNITEVMFYDELSECLNLLPSSVFIGETPQYIDTFNGGINLGTINANSSITISFQAEVLCRPKPSTITNVASVDYYYTISDNGINVTSTGESTSNCATTKILSSNCCC